LTAQPHINLISFGHFRIDFLERVAVVIRTEFDYQVNIREGHLDLSDFYDASRRQYNGNTLLKVVDTRFASDSFKTLGLFSIDLFIPILTYIYGQAMLGGRTGIASHYRLSNERYGMARDEGILLERFCKEVVHELGHLFGLVHCHYPACVMRSSTYVEDIDQKDRHLCERCHTQFHAFIQEQQTP
jgi:archaemetzincin